MAFAFGLLLIPGLLLFGPGTRIAFAANGQAVIEADEYVKTDLNSKTTVAKKNVRVTNDKGKIEADQLTYDSDSGIVIASGGVKLTTQDGTMIQSAQLEYNMKTLEAAFSGGVILTTNGAVKMTAQQMNYNGNSGLAAASGDVKMTTGHGIYQTEAIQYNLNTATGSSGPVSMIIDAKPRNFKIMGDSLEISNGIDTIIKPRITRCQETNSEYQFRSKEATYDGRYLHLINTILYIKGIPVLPLWTVTLDMTNLNFPEIEPGYDPTYGFYFKYHDSGHLSERIRWSDDLYYRSKYYSTASFGLTASKDRISNYTGMFYTTQYDTIAEGYGFEDRITYNLPLLISSIDGSMSFSDNDSTQLGFSVTRKYFESPLGRWQLGILGRKVTEVDINGEEYGGTYGGYRLDYNPHPNFSLSLLRIYSIEGEDYRDFMQDFKIGSNWMYNGVVPLKKPWSFGVNGTYNSDQSLWIYQRYEIYYQTDCFNLAYGWDNATKSNIFTIQVRL
jgi:Organic solvent tolerance protein OstA